MSLGVFLFEKSPVSHVVPVVVSKGTKVQPKEGIQLSIYPALETAGVGFNGPRIKAAPKAPSCSLSAGAKRAKAVARRVKYLKANEVVVASAKRRAAREARHAAATAMKKARKASDYQGRPSLLRWAKQAIALSRAEAGLVTRGPSCSIIKPSKAAAVLNNATVLAQKAKAARRRTTKVAGRIQQPVPKSIWAKQAWAAEVEAQAKLDKQVRLRTHGGKNAIVPLPAPRKRPDRPGRTWHFVIEIQYGCLAQSKQRASALVGGN